MIGDPVRHSLSPVIHNSAYEALGLDWVYLAFPVAAGRGAEGVRAITLLDLAGLSVTMPHKADAMGACDEVDPAARRLGVVNCVARVGERLVGYNTDGQGLVGGLRGRHAWSPDGRRCVVLGAGGAARSVIDALAAAGAAEIVVVNRTLDRALDAAALAPAVARVGGPEEVAAADLVVNATSVGMDQVAPGRLPCDPRHLRSGQLVADLVYHPLETPLLRAARQRGAEVLDGVDILVHLSAAVFALFTRRTAPIEVMDGAARRALGGIPTSG